MVVPPAEKHLQIDPAIINAYTLPVLADRRGFVGVSLLCPRRILPDAPSTRNMYAKLCTVDWATVLKIVGQLLTIVLVLLRTDRELRERK